MTARVQKRKNFLIDFKKDKIQNLLIMLKKLICFINYYILQNNYDEKHENHDKRKNT